MPKSKKPRKAYHPRPIKNPGCYYPRHMLDQVRGIVADVMLVAELTLPRGLATDDHMHQLQDLLNWGGMMLFDQKFPGQKAEVKEFGADHYCALHALSRIIKRKESGKSNAYVGTAEELTYIRDVCQQIADLVREGLEINPEKTIREFLAAKQIVDEEHAEREAKGLPHGVQEMDEVKTNKVLRQKHFFKEETGCKQKSFGLLSTTEQASSSQSLPRNAQSTAPLVPNGASTASS